MIPSRGYPTFEGGKGDVFIIKIENTIKKKKLRLSFLRQPFFVSHFYYPDNRAKMPLCNHQDHRPAHFEHPYVLHRYGHL